MRRRVRKRRGHAFAVAVEELDEVELRADRDDQPRALLGGDQHRDVLARARRGHELEGQAELLQALAAGGAAVGVGVHDQLGAAAQRALAGGVHVADDHVRRQARLEQRVGAAVDGDDHRAHVADERPQRAQVALVARRRGRPRSVERSRKSVAKARQLRSARSSSSRSSRMCSIVLWAKRSSASPISRRRASVSARTRRASSTSPRASSSPRAQHLGAGEPSARATARTTSGSPSETRVEQRVVGQVDEQRSRLDEQLRPEVRIGAARGGPAVEHRDALRGDQLLGGDAVDVEVVDQRDVAGHEMLDEQLRAPPGPHRAGDGGGDHGLPGRRERAGDGAVPRGARSRRSHRTSRVTPAGRSAP